YCLSLTPSLLPRPWLLQAIASGVTATVGYAVGALIAWVARLCGARLPGRVVWWSWIALAVLGPAAVIGVTVWGVGWQDDLRRLMTMDPRTVWWQWTLASILAFVLCALFVLLGRAVRLGTRTLARPLARVIPTRIALLTAAAVVTVVVVGVVQGFL